MIQEKKYLRVEIIGPQIHQLKNSPINVYVSTMNSNE